MTDRIDYIRVLFRGEVEAQVAWKSKITNIMMDFCEPRKTTLKTWGHFNRIYDNAKKEWVESFEAWGLAADYFFQEIPFTDRPNVTRIDYRCEVGTPQVRISTIEHVARVNRGRTRRTITRIDSPPRAKKGDRDAGGDFLAVGSKGSERRTAIYQRGTEPWAIEVQFGKGFPQKIHQRAVDMYLNTEGHTYQTAYMKVAREYFSEAVRDHFHYSIDQIMGTEDVIDHQQGLDFQENLLAQFDEFWDKLDDAARSTLVQKVIAKPETSAIIEESELSEPPDLWDQYSQGAW